MHVMSPQCYPQATIIVAIAAALGSTPALAAKEPDPAIQLDPLTVRGAAETGYTVPNSSSATRTDTPIEHIPQSIVVVPRAVIEEQGATTVSDALRNVSNVTAIDPRDSNNAVFRIRGFTSALVVDGVAMPGYFPNMESLVNVERIDVLKGPAGSLFGSSQALGSFGTLGGTIGITTSEPMRAPLRRVGVSVGSYSERGASFDLSQPLGADFAVRLAAEASRSDSETERVFFKRKALFPSVSWTPSADTKLVLRLRYLDNTTLDYSGLPPSGTLLDTGYTVPRSRIVTAEGLPDTTNTSYGANLQLTQRLNDAWTFSLVAAYNRTEVDQRGVFPFPFGSVGPAYLLAGARLWDEWKTTTLSPSLTGKFATGAARHTLNVGLDYERTRDDAFMTFSNGSGLLSFVPVDLRDPTYPEWVEPGTPSPPDQQNRYRSTVVYVQDQVDVGNWHLLGSLRHSKIKVDDTNPAFFVNNHSSVSKTTPRVGAVYEFTPNVSAFAGYSEGIKTPTVSVFSAPPKPEESKQTEFGMRLKDLFGISATLAWFELTRKNAAVADPANLGFSIQAGKQRARGVDLDLVWQVDPSLRWIASFTSQTARIVEDTTLTIGNQLFNVPRQTARLAARYDIHGGPLNGLGLGLGLTHHSRLPGDTGNTFFTPSATVWDAQASYLIGPARLGLNVRNLTNHKYWVPSTYFGGGQVLPAAPRTLTATASIAF